MEEMHVAREIQLLYNCTQYSYKIQSTQLLKTIVETKKSGDVLTKIYPGQKYWRERSLLTALRTDDQHPQCFQALRAYLVEVYDVDHPGTETCSGRRLLSHKLRVELGVAEVVVPHTLHCGLRDVLFVKVHQSLQEVVHLKGHLCRVDTKRQHL